MSLITNKDKYERFYRPTEDIKQQLVYEIEKIRENKGLEGKNNLASKMPVKVIKTDISDSSSIDCLNIPTEVWDYD